MDLLMLAVAMTSRTLLHVGGPLRLSCEDNLFHIPTHLSACRPLTNRHAARVDVMI